ncbi:MAG TPA: hypothetical protein VM366_00120 [Anaerolineae bacterium]|nr:hypothetical protein [Anaerolineae bacterium]
MADLTTAPEGGTFRRWSFSVALAGLGSAITTVALASVSVKIFFDKLALVMVGR